jgi:hypothetical protein
VSVPTIYRSSDASAPVLTGTAGDLVNLLDKCLADGYGSRAAAGWTKAYTATNQRSYRQGAGNQFYLDVDDRGASGVLTGLTAKEAAVRGYETMSAVSTGTGPFPTAAQVAVATANWRKSAAADTLPRAWILFADDRTFSLFVLDGDFGGSYKPYVFGDFYSLKSGDGYRTAIYVRTSVNGNSMNGTIGAASSTSMSSQAAGLYTARIAAGTGASAAGAEVRVGSGALKLGASWALGHDGNVYISRFLLSDLVSPYLRGWQRGLYAVLNPIGLNDGDTFSGTGDFAGRTFVCIKLGATSPSVIAVETTAWDTSS